MKNYGIEIFKLDQDFEQEFKKYGKVVSFKKKSILFNKNELSYFFYIVLKGKIKSYQINFDNHKEQTLYIYRKGDMFDTVIVLDNKPHEVMYEVLENSELLELPIGKVREWIGSNKQFSRYFFKYVASQMRHIEELASDISLYSTSERVYKLLINNINPKSKNYFKILQNLSKSEIAKIIGTVRHVIERHLKELEKSGIIEISRKNIFIKDMDRLINKINRLLISENIK